MDNDPVPGTPVARSDVPDYSGGPAETEGGAPRRRVWPAVVLVGAYWLVFGVTGRLDVPIFNRFMARFLALAVVGLCFLVWWLVTRRVSWRDRLLVLACAVAAPVVALKLADKSVGPITIVSGVPVMLTAWALWVLLARGAARPVWRNGMIAVLFLSVGAFTLFRMEGLSGEGEADFHWRWSRTPEQLYFAQRQATPGAASRPAMAAAGSTQFTVQPGDWPGFRGPRRDSVVRGLTINPDWAKSPPKELWRQRVGPAWSSVAVVDGRAFTQEQRGNNEAVVCRDAATGAELWSHEEPGRFSEALSSLGPRATPTFADNRIYAQGAAGRLVCLDAATGQGVWSRDVLADSGPDAKMPDWGVCASPLVTKEGIVVVFAASQSKRGLIGYRAETGERAWYANGGLYSYSSPQPATLGGREQVLFMGNAGLRSVDPATGATLWTYDGEGQPPRSLQPMPVDDGRVLVPMGMEVPTDLVDVKRTGDSFAATKRWTSRNLKPSFNDFVVYKDFVYGFDGAIFTCVDLKTGERKWKQGRYGTGQVLLLEDCGLLLVLSDKGEVVLLSAKPEAFEELGQFQAVTGKTWNHPAVAQGRLFVRNAEEMACFELKP